MSDPKPAGEDASKKNVFQFKRVAIWVLVGGVGLYLVISGIIGILVKANQ